MPLVLLSLLLGLLPVADAPAPPPPLSRTPALQAAWNASPEAHRFRQRHGRWSVRWDERNHTPRALLGPGLPLSERESLVRDIARLAGISQDSLVLVSRSKEGPREGWHYAQRWQGLPVKDSWLDVYAEGGRIGFVFASLHRPHPEPWPEAPATAMVLPIEHEGRLEYRVARPVVEGPITRWLDRRGALLLREDSRLFAENPLLVSHEERTVGDPVVSDPARGVFTDDGRTRDTTDDAGSHAAGLPFDATLDGPFLSVWRDGSLVSVSGVADDQLDYGADLSPAASAVLYHFHVVRDWLADLWPDHRWLDDNVPATVDITTSCCNAYYSSGTLNFFIGNATVYNLGRIGDVVYHEYGHGVHHYALQGGTFAGDVSEGSADFVAATLLNDPVLAPNSNTSGGFIRRIDEDRVYPTDLSGEPHNDGLIWASFLWDLREQWSAEYGEQAGVRATDLLFLEALSYGPALTDLYEAVLVSDDDNGDLGDGTPHGCALRELLALHGLTGTVAGSAVLEHEPLGPQASSATEYPVEFGLWTLPAGCGLGDLSAVEVLYTLDPPADASLEDLSWQTLPAELGPDGYRAEIPRQPAGTHVAYAITWRDAAGQEEPVFSHDGTLDSLYSFWVGDRRALWCEGFEAEPAGWTHGPGLPNGESPRPEWLDQWERGAPSGGVFEPTTAPDGAGIFGTNLQGEGQYRPMNQQYARSGSVSLDGAWPTMTLLAYQRYLTVEDGLYDQAVLSLRSQSGERVLWQNASTELGESNALDTDWVLHELDLSAVLDDGPVDFTWSLSSDEGLEFGGWNLDSVCVLTLDDLPGHFRVDDLSASDDAEQVTVRWTNPWVKGVVSTVLLRNRDAMPTGPEDGELLELDPEAAPGEAREWVDSELQPGERAWYAVYVADAPDNFYSESLAGENLDEGGVPAPEPADDSEEPVEEEPDTGVLKTPEARCSCGSTPGAGAPLALLAGLALLRRRDGARRLV